MKLKTYDLFPAFFSFIIDNKIRNLFENMDKNVELMGAGPAMKILEVGCGSGFVTPFLSKAVGMKGSVISVDIQEKMIEKAKRKRGYLQNVDFRVSSAADLNSIADGEIDLAFLYYSFHEIDKKDEAVRELYRVLKQNGILSIKEPRFEVFKKDRKSYKEFIIGRGFEFTESIKPCDVLGCYLKFIKIN
ncbi:MAG: class I SAM-dependent methyltransferase [bacterium]|jgi:ubiquinone/menaquinone biosynthesis C-methylase UbiE